MVRDFVEEDNYHDHACTTPTTGFIFAVGERETAEVVNGWIMGERGWEELC